MKAFHTLFYPVITLMISAIIFLIYLSISRIGEAGLSDFPKMLEGTAFRPSIYRVLVPILARGGASALPSEVIDVFHNLPQRTSIKKTFDKLSQMKYFGEAISALFLMYLSIVGFTLAEKALLKDLGYSSKEQFALPVMLAILILPFSVHFGYVYDLPQVFLFAISTLLLYRRNWPAYLVFLAISLLNKETSFFLITIFAIYYFQRLPRSEFIVLLGAQLGIFAVFRAVIMYIYRNNPGVTIFWSLRYHVDQYTQYPATLILTVILFGAIAFLMIKDWKRKPAFLRYASIVLPLTLVLFFLAGMPMEFRIFLDILPVFGIMLFPSSQTSTREKMTPALQPGAQSNL